MLLSLPTLLLRPSPATPFPVHLCHRASPLYTSAQHRHRFEGKSTLPRPTRQALAESCIKGLAPVTKMDQGTVCRGRVEVVEWAGQQHLPFSICRFPFVICYFLDAG